MSLFLKIKIFIILNFINNYTCFLTDSKQNIVESLNKELNIKHLSIIKDLEFTIDQKILFFVKRLSRQNIYASALSVRQMNYSMNKYYDTPLETDDERVNWVYPPKTMVILYGKNLKQICQVVFTVKNEYPVTKYSWLIVDDLIESYLSSTYYLPYNGLLLQLKSSNNKGNSYLIEEIYCPSISIPSWFSQNFSFWDKDKGLEITEPDIYKRRLDMNGTAMEAVYLKEYEYYIDGCKGLKRMECQIVREFFRVLNLKLILAAYDPTSPFPPEMELQFHIMNYGDYYPFFIGPLGLEAIFFHMAFDESYKDNGISNLLSPLSLPLWRAVLTWICTSTILIMIVQYYYNKKKSISKIPFWNHMFEPFESFLNQSGQDPPNKFSFSVITIATRLAALFIVPAYTGAILSFILLPKVRLPFDDIKGFAEDGSYRLGYMIDYLNLEGYYNDSYDPYFKKIYKELSVPLRGTYENAVREGITKMCKDHKFVFAYYGLTINYEDCTPIKISSYIMAGWSIIRLRYNSPYMKIFNRIFKTIRSSGVYERMKNDQYKAFAISKIFIKSNELPDDDGVKVVKISNLLNVFITIGIVYSISSIILLLEILFHKIKY